MEVTKLQKNVTPPKLPKQLSPKIIGVVIAVVVLLVVLSSSFYTVDQTEEAIILLFGKFSRVETPGLHTKIPFGIEQNINVATEVVHKEEFVMLVIAGAGNCPSAPAHEGVRRAFEIAHYQSV